MTYRRFTPRRPRRRGLRTLGAATLALALCTGAAAGPLPGAAPASATAAAAEVAVRPDPTYRHDTFEGWGSSLVWMANATGGYPDEIRDRLVDMTFGADGLNLNIARYNIGGGNAPDVPGYLRPGGAVPGWWKAPAGTVRTDTDWWTPGDAAEFDPAADPRQRWWVDRIKDRVTRWEAFSNSPPWFQTVSGYASGGFDPNTDQLRTDRIDDFAAYLTRVVDELERAHGIDVATLNPFNEPNTNYWHTTLGPDGNPTGGRQEGAHMGPQLQAAVIPALAAALRGASADPAISAPDETTPTRFAEDWEGYPQDVRDRVGQLNVHTYGTADRPVARDIAKGAAKPLSMSEVGGEYEAGQNFTSMGPGLGLAHQIIDDLRELEPRSWILWQPIEDLDNMSPGGETPQGGNWGEIQVPFDCGPQDTLATCPIRTNTKFHTMRNFTHHIRPGDRVVPTADDDSIAAMRGEDLTSVVHVNDGDARTVRLDLSGFAATAPGATVTPVVTDANGALVRGAAVPVADGAARIDVPARSVTTLLVSGVSGVAAGSGVLGGEPVRIAGVGSGLALEPLAGGGVAQQTADPQAAGQQWRLARAPGRYGSTDTVTVTHAATGRPLAVVDGSPTTVEPGRTDDAARWRLSTTGDGVWTLLSAVDGRLLDVPGAATEAGTRIGLHRPNGDDNQRWTITSG